MGNRDNDRNNSNSLGAMLAGMAIGAAAVALSNKENRDKIKQKAMDIKEKGKDKLNRINSTIQKEKNVAKGALKKSKDVMDSEMNNDQSEFNDE